MRSSGFLAAVLLAFLFPARAAATLVDLDTLVIATASDKGPQDGIFDEFPPLNLGSVNNNGYTSFRTAMEFDLSAIPSDPIINKATLTMFVGWVEGSRQIALNGYTGDGNITLGDFSLDGLVGVATLNPRGSYSISFDATNYLQELIARGGGIVGFNVREDPPNLHNYGVLFFQATGVVAPRLSVDYVASAVPEPSTMFLLGIGFLGLVWLNRRRRRG